MKIGILCSKTYMNKTIDNRMLLGAFEENDIEAIEIAYDSSEDYDFGRFDSVIVRTTWGYQYDHKEYLRCLRHIDSKCILLNRLEYIEKNIDKANQIQNLMSKGIPVIKTVVLDDDLSESEEMINRRIVAGSIVLKPNISAGGDDPIKLGKSDGSFAIPEEYFNRVVHEDGKRILAQPYVDEISEGEISLIYICGVFSHAIRRVPGVLSEGKESRLIHVTEKLIRFGYEISEVIKGTDLLYSRIDLVIVDGNPIVLEIEVNEPDLFFRKCEDLSESVLQSFVDGTRAMIGRMQGERNR